MLVSKIVLKHFTAALFPKIRRPLFISSQLQSNAYDSDGKTTVTILNQTPGFGLMIDSYSTIGFRLNNGAFIVGPIVLFPKTVLSWNIMKDEDISENSLDLFTVLEPPPDVLVLGFGNEPDYKRELDKILHSFRVKKKLNLEILPTDKAVSTFNFLNAEGRFVAAALIPPKRFFHIDDDINIERKRRKGLYESDD